MLYRRRTIIFYGTTARRDGTVPSVRRDEGQRGQRGHGRWVRHKLDLDLSDPDVRAEVHDGQIAYYGQRAAWYDDVYDRAGDYDRGEALNAAWRAELAFAEERLAAAPLHGTCVELGIGTGHWTERYLDRVEQVVGLDASAPMLERARRRLLPHADKVELAVADLWAWQPDRVWDCAVACFFLEHVPDEVLPGLLRSLHGALRPGGTVFVAEAAASGMTPQVESRAIHDRTFLLVDRPRTRAELVDAFGSAGFEVDIDDARRLVVVIAQRR
jgi:SAM-dependent methyltransferase